MTAKEQAAAKALEFVRSGMVLGLGSGSTSKIFVDMLGEKLKNGELENIVGIPTSEATAEQAKSLGISLSTIDEHGVIDLAVDGADEVDPDLQLVKGWGRALLREKMVEIHAKELVIIVDDSKLVEKLGTRDFIPVEVVQFGYGATIRWMNESLEGCKAELWNEDGEPVVTDNGNYLVKLFCDGGVEDPYILADMLAIRPGVVEHGLFLDLATKVVVAGESGMRVLEKDA
ncbi:ribose 5-phosphate isomerase A [Candidatus Peregrinibacteria bacterium]|nr:ribose 5-phosphate isomerase A [Candidatus Peregrinibacteria bacterium]